MPPTPSLIFLVSEVIANPMRARRPQSAAVRTQCDTVQDHTAKLRPLSGAGCDSDRRWPTFQAGAFRLCPRYTLVRGAGTERAVTRRDPGSALERREHQTASSRFVKEENPNLLRVLFRDGECRK